MLRSAVKFRRMFPENEFVKQSFIESMKRTRKDK